MDACVVTKTCLGVESCYSKNNIMQTPTSQPTHTHHNNDNIPFKATSDSETSESLLLQMTEGQTLSTRGNVLIRFLGGTWVCDVITKYNTHKTTTTSNTHERLIIASCKFRSNTTRVFVKPSKSLHSPLRVGSTWYVQKVGRSLSVQRISRPAH
jgi:hypothetical protein